MRDSFAPKRLCWPGNECIACRGRIAVTIILYRVYAIIIDNQIVARGGTLCSGNHERVAFSCLNSACPEKIRHYSNSICLIWDICLSLLIVNEFLSPIASNGAGSQRATSQDERPENKPSIGLLQLCLVQSQINPGVP